MPLAALRVDGPLRVGVVDLAGELLSQSGGLPENSVYVDLAQGLLSMRRGRVNVLELELLDVREAEQGVSVEDLVVDEGERELPVEGTSHSDSLHISTAIALMSAPYRQVAMTVRIAWVFSSAASGR